jgi:hypothetical protein
MNLQPKQLRRLSLSRREGDVPGRCRSIYTQNLDGQDNPLRGGIRKSNGNRRRSQK